MTGLMAFAAILGVVVVACAIWYLLRAGRMYQKLAGDRVVTCPETGRPAGVRIDARYAAASTIRRQPAEHLRLANCWRWEARGRCDEACLAEAADPQSTTSAIASGWYEGRTCVYCGEPVHDDVSVGHHAALLDQRGATHEWSDVPPPDLPDALGTGRPVCWNCHIAETFRRQYPQLVTDR